MKVYVCFWLLLRKTKSLYLLCVITCQTKLNRQDTGFPTRQVGMIIMSPRSFKSDLDHPSQFLFGIPIGLLLLAR